MKFYYKEESSGGVHRYRLYATLGDKKTEIWISQATDECSISLTCALLNKMAKQEKGLAMTKSSILDTALAAFRLKVADGEDPSFDQCLHGALYIHCPEQHPPAEKENETYIPNIGVVRPCLDCGALVAGGRTRCGRCVEEPKGPFQDDVYLGNNQEGCIKCGRETEGKRWYCSQCWAGHEAWIFKSLPSPGTYKEIAGTLTTALVFLDKSKGNEGENSQLLWNNDFKFARSLILAALHRIEDIYEDGS